MFLVQYVLYERIYFEGLCPTSGSFVVVGFPEQQRPLSASTGHEPFSKVYTTLNKVPPLTVKPPLKYSPIDIKYV